MARPKKNDKKLDESGSLQISLEDFIRARDLVVTGLATLQSALQDLSRAYITHTNTVIGKAPSSFLELLTLANPLGANTFGAHPTTTTPNDNGDSKKRKRAPHDKNAPKRPVTPYFLYMQTARLKIAAEMAPSCYTAKEVAKEGTRRWNEMKPEEREIWSYIYAISFTRYKEKVKAYKAGLPIPEISDLQAKELYDEQQKIGIFHMPPPGDLAHAIDYLDSDTSVADGDTSSSDETPEPSREQSPPRISRSSKRRNIAEKNSAALQEATEKTPTQDEQVFLPPAPTLEERVRKYSKKDRKKKAKKSEIKDFEAVDIKPSSFAELMLAKQDTPGKLKRSKRERESEGAEY